MPAPLGRKRAEGSADGPSARHAAMKLLARREHSRLELERKLGARAFAPEAIETALDELERDGLLSAGRFTESFVRARIDRGRGPVRIRAELAERGIAEAEYRDFLAADAVDWSALARRALVKRFGAGPPADFADRARRARFLSYRGFDASHIDSALDLDAESD
jgi:regulatory protein